MRDGTYAIMHTDLSRDALIQLVHRYYPANIEAEDPRYMASEEAQRLSALLQTHQKPLPVWTGFIQRLHKEFPGCSIWDTTVPHADPCYSCRVSLPGFVTGAPLYDCVVCLVSQLAPVYALYASHVDRAKLPERDYWLRFPPFPPEFQIQESNLAGLIEATFGFTRLSNEVLFTPVPDLIPRTVNFQLGKAKLIDCLLTEHRY